MLKVLSANTGAFVRGLCFAGLMNRGVHNIPMDI